MLSRNQLRPPLTFLLTAVMLCSVVNAARGQEPSQRRKLFEEALARRQYDVAQKLAVLYFQPYWHCEVIARQARRAKLLAERIIEDQESRREQDNAELDQADDQINEARRLGMALIDLADQYVEAGWEQELKAQATDLRESELSGLDELNRRLGELRQRGKPFGILITQPTITTQEIEPLDWDVKWIMGFYLVDRGAFEQAIDDCFEKLRLDDASDIPPEAKQVARFVTELLNKWHVQAGDSAKWDNLVRSGLDRFDALCGALPQRTDLAGWLIALISHLARDHYDVRPDAIGEVLIEVEKLLSNGDNSAAARLLQAKLRHEQFLLKRRAEEWTAELPPVVDLDLFVEMRDYWYAAEAALIAAGALDKGERANRYEAQCLAQIQLLAASEKRIGEPESLAKALNKRVQRYEATLKTFDEWLDVARRPEFRDFKNMVLPEVLVETRPELMARVRQGYEQRIAKLIANQELEQAFMQAQEGKALAVGRIVEAISVDRLLSSRMLVTSVGEDLKIPNKPLFIEYFFGPTRAWAFYVFAAGDKFDPLKVVELDAQQIRDRCKAIVEKLQAGEPVDDPGAWMLGGTPIISELWSQLEFTGAPRHIVIAPDGPMCYVPLAEPQFKTASAVTFIPTAAVLGTPKAFDRVDLQRMWAAQREDLTTDIPTCRIRGGTHIVELWPDMRLELQLRDTAN